jgi:hypothetical protein
MCQYTCNDINVFIGFGEVNLKAIQFTLQKIITWTKRFGKGRSKWHRAFLNVGVSHQKLKAMVKTRFINKMTLF